ncbi:hypothetical protein [Pseudomonas fluorescens]|uniref:hypothetical protein n=1 Tax=Pseudomonas fluorescens TaxID=294 RepID=UPI001242D11F|nr:hypothetical protein [Pseudomonas fluorescens]
MPDVSDLRNISGVMRALRTELPIDGHENGFRGGSSADMGCALLQVKIGSFADGLKCFLSGVYSGTGFL